ncbi:MULTISPECIES: hypothetical protein [unclassified Mesorhizobium]|uniref:hypothetical protein n=1 Tax=unclassified Mesorhizobium TaxID=325217 RepID=UPI00301484C8
MKDVIDVRLMVVDTDASLPATGEGAAIITPHRQLYRITAFVRRYTQAPLRFAMPLPALMRIFDDVKYQQLEGRLLEGIARLFGSNVRLLACPCPRDELLHLLTTESGHGWEVDGNRQWITAEQLRPAPSLRHLYEYLLASGFLVAMPPN